MIEGLSDELDRMLQERLEKAEAKRKAKQAEREEFKTRRDHGLAARHAAKLQRIREGRP